MTSTGDQATGAIDKFSELDNELRAIVLQLVALASPKRSRLTLQLSREELLAHFSFL